MPPPAQASDTVEIRTTSSTAGRNSAKPINPIPMAFQKPAKSFMRSLRTDSLSRTVLKARAWPAPPR